MRRGILICGTLGLLLCTAFPATAPAQSSQAANKIHVAASTVDKFGPTAAVTILSTTLRTSAFADLLLSVSAECAIAVSDVDTAGSGFQSNIETDSALAVIRVWVVVDGAAVPVSGTDNGKVVFCRRQSKESSFVPSGIPPLSVFEATRSAHAFNWIARNVGAGDHTVAARMEILQAASATASFGSGFGFGTPTAPVVQGLVGRRTLVVEPVSPAR